MRQASQALTDPLRAQQLWPKTGRFFPSHFLTDADIDTP